MHDELLEQTIKQAAEGFEPPWIDVRTVVKRGRRRWWSTRPAVAVTTLALVAGAALGVARVDFGESREGGTETVAASALSRWEPMAEAPIGGRMEPLTAWTGDELIVWGGYASDGETWIPDGASYDPATDTWETLSRGEAPAGGVYGQATVWTGSELISWGGEERPKKHGDGHRGLAFDPSSGTWRSLARSPYWSLGGHTAVWTGDEVLAWGGVPAQDHHAAAAYDPAADDWRRIPLGPLGNRHGHEAVWTGDEMIVWGGRSLDGDPVTGPQGAAFDPATNRWRPVAESPLEPVQVPLSLWTGREMIVVGGLGETMASRAGAAYDPAADEWRPLPETPLAAERDDAPTPLLDVQSTPVWTGREAVFVTGDGVLAYVPDDDRWVRVDAPRSAGLIDATTAWTGDALLVWSGRGWDDPDYSDGGWIAREG